MRTRRILDAALVVWVASCSPAVAVPETVATDSPAPQVALRADHMVLDGAVRGTRVLVAVQSGRVEVFDWLEGEALEPLLTLPLEPGHRYPPTISSVAISPGGRLLAAAASDGKLRILELDGEEEAGPLRTIAAKGVQVCRFLDDRRLLLGELTGELALLALDEEREVFRRQLEYDPIYALAVSPAGRRGPVGAAPVFSPAVEERVGGGREGFLRRVPRGSLLPGHEQEALRILSALGLVRSQAGGSDLRRLPRRKPPKL